MNDATRKAIAINVADVRDNNPQEWFPLVMLAADPTFDTISAEARARLAERDLITLTGDGYVMHEMIREVITEMTR